MAKSIFALKILAFSLLSAWACSAQITRHPAEQRNELGLVIGATETPGLALQRGGPLNFNFSLALGAEYDYRLLSHKTLSVGIDFLASPFDVQVSSPAPDVSPQYAYLFLVPHVRLTLHSGGAICPWLLFGGGYADFTPAKPRVALTNSSGGGSTGTLEFGGGVDTKPLLHLKGIPLLGDLPIGARFEVRDFYSGRPNYRVATTGNLQNSVVFSGGLLLRF